MHARLAEIHRKYELMGVTAGWVSAASLNGRCVMLPDGAMAHEAFMERLNDIVESMQTGVKQSVHVELLKHLNRFKPINAEAFYDNIAVLIEEETRILNEIRAGGL